MATMHAAYWGWRDDVGLQTMAQRLLPFAPAVIAPELEVPDVPVPVRGAPTRVGGCCPSGRPGWTSSCSRSTRTRPRWSTRWPSTPATFLHGDWKMGNLGWHPEGRTILLDWAYLGAGPAAAGT